MSRWFRVYDDLVDDPKVQRLSGPEFKKALLDAMDGKDTPFSRFFRNSASELPFGAVSPMPVMTMRVCFMREVERSRFA